MSIQVEKVSTDWTTLPGGLTWYFIGQPKTWKSTSASRWSEKGQEGVLLLDLDLGADFVEGANVVTVTSFHQPRQVQMIDGKKLIDKDGKVATEKVPPEERGYYYRSGPNKGQPMPVYSMDEVYYWIRKEWEKLPYDTLVIDTIDEFNKWVEIDVVEELKISMMGDYGWGADWGKARRRNLDVVVKLQRFLKKTGSNLILVSHSKPSSTEDNKVQLRPELPRGLGYALCAKAEVIGYITKSKEDDNAYISFRSYDERTVGSRLRPLEQKKLLFDYTTVRNEILSYKEEE